MRITYVLPAYYRLPIGGYHVHYEYANRLSRAGHEVTILFPFSLAQNPSRIEAARWALRTRLYNRPLVVSYPLDKRIKVRLPRDLGSGSLPKADILIATAWQTAEALRNAPARAGSRFYIVYDYEYWMSADPPTRARMAATYRAGFKMIATSGAVAEMIEGEGGRPSAQIACGVDLDAFGMDRPFDQRPRLSVGFAARSEPFKGCADAVAAAALLRERFGAVRVACFGSRSIDLPDWIEQHRSPDAAGLRAFYNAQSVFMTASHYEGWGLPSVEAMACGTTLVTTDNGGSRDYAMNGRTALVVPARSPAALAGAVAQLFDDESERVRLAEAGHDYVGRFTWEQASRQLIAAIAQG